MAEAEEAQRVAEASEHSFGDFVHRLPRARVVDRVDWLVERCRDQQVVHVGFADSGTDGRPGLRRRQGDGPNHVGFADSGTAGRRRRDGRWLHEHLADAAAVLVGIDSDSAAVADAVRAGYQAHAVDCTDPGAVAALGLEPADIVVAGEVIQYVDRPGLLLKGLRHLCQADGQLIITTPNAYGLLFTASAILRGIELNDPNHVMMFTQRTLTELARRNGWHVVETVTYVLTLAGRGDRSRLEAASTQVVLGIERILGRLGRPFAADGLIVVAEPA